MPTKLDKAYEHVTGIYRNYPDWPSTFGFCSTEGCENMARGSGMCAHCHEKALAEYSGEEAARKFHEEIKAKSAAYIDLVVAIKSR